MKKSSRLKFLAWSDIRLPNAYKAKSALQAMVSYVLAAIPISRISNDGKAITYNRKVVTIPETVWAIAIDILGIRPIAKAAGQRDLG